MPTAARTLRIGITKTEYRGLPERGQGKGRSPHFLRSRMSRVCSLEVTHPYGPGSPGQPSTWASLRAGGRKCEGAPGTVALTLSNSVLCQGSWVTEGQRVGEWRRKPCANAEFQNDPCFCQLASRGWHKGGWSRGALPNPESEVWAPVPELSFLNTENPSDSFNPLEPCWPHCPST